MITMIANIIKIIMSRIMITITIKILIREEDRKNKKLYQFFLKNDFL